MKNPLAFGLALAALMLSIWGLATKHAQAAEESDEHTYNVGTTVIKTAVLDRSKAPEIVVSIICVGDTEDGVVLPCTAELKHQCPNGGNIMHAEETPQGFKPLGIALLVRCIHEAEADAPATPEPTI